MNSYQNLVDALVEAKMDIPVGKLEMTPQNLAWLGRNLAIRNRNHPKFSAVARLLLAAMKESGRTSMILM